MDWCVNSTSVVIVGAGFSAAATDGSLPLMTGYFDRLRKEDFPELYEFVREVGCNRTCLRIEDANVERVLITVDQIRTASPAFLRGWLGHWKEKLSQLREQLSLYTLSRLSAALELDPNNWAVRILAECGLRTTVISMNYDNIAERILSNRDGVTHGDYFPTCPHCKMRLLLERACSCAGKSSMTENSWRGALIKLHGSIAWKRCLHEDCCSFDCLVANEQCEPFEPCQCPNCGFDCGPALVMPTMSKSLEDLEWLSTMWQAATLALRNAESLLIFGFSFPTSDELLVQLVRSSCETGGKLKRIAAIDLDPERILDRFQSCLPIGYDVETAAFPVLKGESPIWLQEHGNATVLHS
jgi:hypothetical protein